MREIFLFKLKHENLNPLYRVYTLSSMNKKEKLKTNVNIMKLTFQILAEISDQTSEKKFKLKQHKYLEANFSNFSGNQRTLDKILIL